MASTGKTPLNPLNHDFVDENKEYAKIVLSKNKSQKETTLRDINFKDYEQYLEKTLTETSVEIRIQIKDEWYGYGFDIPGGHKIYPDKTVVETTEDTIKVKIFKETKFRLKDAMMS
ncbi:uncharacterized protein LOC134257026 [Saccostrea cucullata]|uniref:uncharacterized protein LOC134257026 n=1 Tax=Saccostrea cuccullata TaxID=36930 RepID=UPI002ED4790D